MKLNVIIDLLGMTLAAVLLLMRRREGGQKDEHRLFYLLTRVLLAIFIIDIPAWLIDGQVFPGAVTVSYLLNSLYYTLQAVYSWLWLVFTDLWLGGDAAATQRRSKWYAIPLLAELALIAVNPPTGWIFTVSSQTVYSRGSGYILNLIPYALYILASLGFTLIAVLREQDPARRRPGLYFLAAMFFPVLGFAIEAFSYGVSWLWPFVSLSLLMIFLYRQHTVVKGRG